MVWLAFMSWVNFIGYLFWESEVKVPQSCPTLQFHGEVHGILQARIVEWVAIPFSGDLPNLGIKPRSPTLQADALPTEPPGKPIWSEGVF